MNNKTNISLLSKVAATLLVLAVLMPSAVKLFHTFNHHEHFVCNEDGKNHSTHIHKLDFDCEFYKYKLNNGFYTFLQSHEEFEANDFVKTNLSYYFFLRTHQQDTSYLRGPPFYV
ncbi:hypothetical protein [Winogradskyella alexanderae]|uniref:Uncharacterized protein n=1 Tax=Winogradskyella alexanderae TaxID=2877123 RepID=A0ABS7XRL1_9FLAO|nr:hypothetical protein [Winogradskyella alexanderae]MCA0132662.1 hypothetical protein [Winogradskyella alexanderae]